MRIHVAAELVVSEESEQEQEQTTPSEFGDIISETDSATIYDTAIDGVSKPLVYKCFHKPLSPAGKERFDEVCAAAKAIDHPNITAVYEYGVASDGNAYVISEKAEGVQLSAVLTARGALNAVTATSVFGQILDAIDYAFSQNVHVGDLAPDRIFVQGLESDTPVVKVTGIGVGRNAFEQDFSAKSLVADVNAAAYASPERCLGKETNQKSIVYSVGCMLYEVIFGKRAFEGSDPIKLLFDHVNATNIAFPAITKSGFGRFRLLVCKCMETNSEQRFKDINTLRHHVENIEEPIRNEREATVFQQMAMLATGARTPLGGEVFVVFSLLIALMCTSGLIRKHILDCEHLERCVQKLNAPIIDRSPDEMIKAWKSVQLRGMQLGQPLSFFADCDIQIAQWETAKNDSTEAFAHYKNAAGIYHRGRMLREELDALTSAVMVYSVDNHFDDLYPVMLRRINLANRLGDQFLMQQMVDEYAYLCASKAGGPEPRSPAAEKVFLDTLEKIRTSQSRSVSDRSLNLWTEQLGHQIQPSSGVQPPGLISRP